MTRSRSRPTWPAPLLVAAAIAAVACGGPSQPTVSSTTPGSRPPSATPSAGPFSPMVYPPERDAPCDQRQAPDADHAAYAGNLRRISATDAGTVIFELCAPDVAFPARLASAAFAINDSAWLGSHLDRAGQQAIVTEVNGTGPYRLDAWRHGSEIDLARNDAYWGEAARNERLIVRWHDGAAQRLAELRAGSVDGIEDVAPSDVGTIEDDAGLRAAPRAGLNVFYVGFNNTYAPFDDPRVRQAIAMGIDRQRIVDGFYPPGSEVASHFSPCAVPYACGGEAWYEFDPAPARQLLAEAGFPHGFATTIQYRDVARPYLPDPTAVAVELQTQLRDNLDIRAALEVLPDETFLATVDDGRADGIHLLGRSAAIPDAASLLDPHFGAGASREFGEPVTALVDALAAGAASPDEAARAAAYADANAAIRSDVPMVPIAHAGSMTAYRADVAGVRSSPVRSERFAAMTPGDRRQLVWLTSAEPEGLYCADETSAIAQLLCSQMSEGLYAFVPGSASVAPALGQACKPNPELSIWTCTLRKGVTFHDGAVLDSNDVVLSFAVQWDAEHPLHRGRQGRFDVFVETFGELLNPPG